MAKKVVIGLSGGLDSSMAAFLLKKEGFEVIGLHFSFTDEKYPDEIQRIADELDINVISKNISNDFSEVKNYFVDQYFEGKTPSPCTFCNRIIKWKKLLEFANQNNCDYIATGHYIRKIFHNGYYYLQKGIDPVKDQSYFLWELNSSIIERMLNPLGSYTKDQIRQVAIDNGFNFLAAKKESMGVCFLQNTDYRDFIKEQVPLKVENIHPGVILNEKGEKIGKHKGYIYYTIGQKRDLDIDNNQKAYVTKIDCINNIITVGEKESLNHYNILLNKLHFINPSDIKTGTKITINIRGYGLNPNELAIIKELKEDTILLKLNSAAWAVAPGQPVVFYKEDIILGGGIAIKSW